MSNIYNMFRSIDVNIHPTVDEIAEAIWEMDSREQCELINLLGGIAKRNEIVTQLEYVRQDGLVNENGQFFCNMIKDYLTNT